MAKEKFIVAIGASAGGTTILPELLKQLTDDIKVAAFVVMHLSKQSIGDLLVKRLQKYTSFTCKIPMHGETIKEQHVYIAMPDHHLMVSQNKILLGHGPMENRYRPSIDALFRSAAVNFAPKVIGIILTGMLEDGASGMYAIQKSGGVCIIQDPGEAKYSDMPQAVLNTLKPDYAIPVSEMGGAIKDAISNLKRKKKGKIPSDIIKEAAIAERVNIGIEEVKNPGEVSVISCPDCGGSLWEMKGNGFTRYRCHLGHAYSQEGLVSSMEVSTESTLWTALRIIEERRNLLRQIGNKESKNGKSTLAATYLKRSAELEAHIGKLKEILFAVGKNLQ
jgi:two-component system chemotaxis response regulator CheB